MVVVCTRLECACMPAAARPADVPGSPCLFHSLLRYKHSHATPSHRPPVPPPCTAARAMLMRADILLLDEPTNHMDVGNVKWLENYLVNRPEISSVGFSGGGSGW